MVEREFFKNSLTHHDRDHRITPRDADSEDINSRVEEPTTRDDERHEHHEEEDQHEERGTEMTKRAGKILSSLALTIMFICGLPNGAAAAERVIQRDDAIDSVRLEKIFDMELERNVLRSYIRRDFNNILDGRIENIVERRDLVEYDNRQKVDGAFDRIDDLDKQVRITRLWDRIERRDADAVEYRFGAENLRATFS